MNKYILVDDALLLEIDIKREKLRNIPSLKRRRVIKDYHKFIYTITLRYDRLVNGSDDVWHSDSAESYLIKLDKYLALF